MVGGLVGFSGDVAGQGLEKGWAKIDWGQAALSGAFGAAGGAATRGLAGWGLQHYHDHGRWSGRLAQMLVPEAKLLGYKVCFAAGTPLRTPEGSKPIEQFRVGDLVLARDEGSPEGPVEAKAVEEVFVRSGFVLHLHARGRVVRTTSEHPFYVKGEGWVQAGLLRAGDLLSSHDGQWVEVEEVFDTGEYETVYNLRVADHHTYFVGCDEWGFSVWAHNAYREFSNVLRKRGVDREVIKDAFGKIRAGGVEEARAVLRAALDNGKRSPAAIDRMIHRAASQVDSLSRPSAWRAGFVEKVERRMPTMPDGKPAIYDLVEGKVVLRGRLPGEAVDIGHIPGMEHRKLVQQYSEMTQSEFNQLLHENPRWFRMESDLLSKSHKGEIR